MFICTLHLGLGFLLAFVRGMCVEGGAMVGGILGLN
jgi:hypothetical protein